MRPTADRTSEPAHPPESGTSGKVVIIGILVLALAGAGTSWWFRYFTTHEAVDFWGPQAALLIRDAESVRFLHLDSKSQSALPRDDFAALLRTTKGVDISQAHGLSHLRNALLEDRSYEWPAESAAPSDSWQTALVFSDAQQGGQVILMFSPDAKSVKKESVDTPLKLSCEPIAAGLREMFAEFSALPAASAEPAAPAR